MTKNIKRRFLNFVFALVTVLGLCKPVTSYAADYSTGGWAMVYSNLNVYDENSNYVGTVFAFEGVTVLYISGNSAYIEYSTPNGPKRGFVSKYSAGVFLGTCVGRITTSSDTYYSTNTSFYAGHVDAGEFVSVIAKTGSWAYIEYNNTTNGTRKRAFISSGNVSYYKSNSYISGLYQNEQGYNYPVSSYITVYNGPSNQYATIGNIYPSDNGHVTAYADFVADNGRTMKFVGYPAGNTTKYGYIYVN